MKSFHNFNHFIKLQLSEPAISYNKINQVAPYQQFTTGILQKFNFRAINQLFQILLNYLDSIFCIIVMSYLEDYISRLNLLPEESNKRLRHIRELDKKVDANEKQLEKKQKQFIDRVAQSKGKKDIKQRELLEQFYKQIINLHKECHTLSQQKVRLADQLYNLIHEPTERLEIDLKRMKTDFKDENNYSKDKTRKVKAFKKKVRRSKPEQPTQANQPRYCYCGRTSYGQMVQCENKFCENEWFHIGCIQQKVLPQKWYCRNCRKTQQGTRTLRNR